MIKRPVLTLHNALDVVAVAAHESAYRNTVAAVDRDDLLVQVSTTGIGHGGGFPTPPTDDVAQLLAAIQAVDGWARSGRPPASSTFPAELGFIPGFVPPPWPQP